MASSSSAHLQSHRCSNRSRSARRLKKGINNSPCLEGAYSIRPKPLLLPSPPPLPPPAGVMKMVAAVKKIQRSVRRFISIKNTVDPITLNEVKKYNAHDVLLVETTGIVAFRFDARTLVAHFLLSSSFLHPFIGRELLSPEVWRVGAHAGFGGRALTAIYSLRDVVVKHRRQRESLITFLEDEMRSTVTRALQKAEAVDRSFIISPFNARLSRRLEQEVLDEMDDYISLAERSARSDPESCRASLKADMTHFAHHIHETTIIADDLSPGETIVYTALKNAENETRDECQLEKPRTAMGNWLRDILKGR
jgi:hypothetical protein